MRYLLFGFILLAGCYKPPVNEGYMAGYQQGYIDGSEKFYCYAAYLQRNGYAMDKINCNKFTDEEFKRILEKHLLIHEREK